jgi:hypothetical protein
MTTPEEPLMPAKRAKRPKLERDQPNRSWSTLFGAAPAKQGAPPAHGPAPGRPDDRAALSDTVQLGYRVVEDYLKQSQQAAQAFAPSSWPGAGPAGATDEMQQMAQRVMQYGWDFAGLWMEMWTRMGGMPGFRPPVPGFGMDPRPGAGAAAPGTSVPSPSAPAPQPAPVQSESLAISVDSVLPTVTSVTLRPGQPCELVVHALRAEGHEAAPIRSVSIQPSEEDGRMVLQVIIPADQAPGEYRAVIAEAASNLPRGMLSVRVQPKR